MYKLLIADDERIVREGLARLCDWAMRDIALCPAAQNGLEARNLILSLRPDIAILDIRMPLLSGLEVIEQTAATAASTRFILLSGYGEFDYAKRAMARGVRHFILKPCNDQQLLGAIDALRTELDNDQFVRDYVAGRVSGHEARTRCARILSMEETPENASNREIVRHMVSCAERLLSDERLSLNFLAREILFANADYLGKLFKRQTGSNFSAYLQRRRIEEAKALFQADPPLKIYEVARLSGFGDNTQYFSQQFKKATGETPTEYAHAVRNQ